LLTDLAHRAHHELAIKTKTLATAYYGTSPTYCYFEGASTGGRHGHRLAQEHPEHYDGIIALLPTISFHEWVLSDLYRRVVVERDLDGNPLTEEQMDLVSNAAIDAGDLVGGEHLGYIFDNEACQYDPTGDPKVTCVADGGTSSSPHCVTKAQTEAIKKMWYGPTRDGSVPDAAVDNGTQVDLGDRLWYGLAQGTSLYIAYFTKHDVRMRELLRGSAKEGNGPSADHAALVLQDVSIAGPSFHNATGDGEAKWRELTYEQIADLFRRAREMDGLFGYMSSDDPDLSAFKARGGKFLSWHGWNDESIPVQTSMRYYDRVVQTMGGLENVQSFFKFYAIPGAGHMSPHGTSNEDANPPIPGFGQLYGLLVDWVENGVEPGPLEVTSPLADRAPITYRIPAYPQRAIYAGGDPRIASSYAIAD
jgi:pimeloyl-ACP methyl ester carboxylesterase